MRRWKNGGGGGSATLLPGMLGSEMFLSVCKPSLMCYVNCFNTLLSLVYSLAHLFCCHN